ncbi:hypothetical protein Pisl_0411 [Pyrobaculum islandicum DSM 4184]|uniref:Uncharacterized protein n=1 Tax=Pyrobaculum islandicum (strain DSM 4184 / JCM 9189 / GEO3) TaxID=384616 RepID=A1RRK7_PYRIL|nr:CAP domain-containing protein [Pyrobaculum islandicum]ABL87589.1 hypothetical protein Pisl_0411 [Pyrobaculum islandicum DSM 4184]
MRRLVLILLLALALYLMGGSWLYGYAHLFAARLLDLVKHLKLVPEGGLYNSTPGLVTHGLNVTSLVRRWAEDLRRAAAGVSPGACRAEVNYSRYVSFAGSEVPVRVELRGVPRGVLRVGGRVYEVAGNATVYLPYLGGAPAVNYTFVLETPCGSYSGVVTARYLLPPTPPEETYNGTPSGLRRLALEYLNQIREREGVPPVRWIPLKTPQYRAEYMLKTGIYSHYDAEGRHPIYYYTKLDGGKYAAEENGAMARCLLNGKPVRCGNFNMTDFIVGSIRSMVYNDSHANWGHRRSLLDPCNNYVSVGIVYNGSEAHMTIYMVSKWVRWIKPPAYNGTYFIAEGYVEGAMAPFNYTRWCYPVAVFYDVPTSAYVRRSFYTLGNQTGWFCEGVAVENGGMWYFRVEVPFNATKHGLYTFVIVARDTRGITWEPKPGAKATSQYCQLATYTAER